MRKLFKRIQFEYMWWKTPVQLTHVRGMGVTYTKRFMKHDWVIGQQRGSYDILFPKVKLMAWEAFHT